MRITKNFSKIAFLLVLVVGVLSGFFLIRKTQYLSSRALTPSSVGGVNFSLSDSQNGLIKVDLAIRTGTGEGTEEAMSIVSFKLSATSKSGKTVSLVDGNGNSINEIAPDSNLVNAGNWQFPVNKSDNNAQGFFVDFSGVFTGKNGFSSVNPVNIASFWVKGADSRDDLNLEFDKQNSVMYSKRRPVTNIWMN